MDFITYQELFNVARDEALAKNSNLTREVIERPGTDANAIYSGAAAVGDAVTAQLISAEASTFLDSAKGKQLDRLVFDRYGLLRKPASPAFGTVQFTSTTPAAVAFSIPAGFQLLTTDGKTFFTTTNVTYPQGSTGPVSVPVRSADAGINQQARIGTISNLGGTVPSSPTDLAVTNTVATAGAANEENDESLRERARRFFTTARRGTVKAIEAAALAVPGVFTASAFETYDEFGRPARSVQLVVTDEFTTVLVDADPTPTGYETQSQVLASNVFLALNDVRAAGIYVDVKVAVVKLLGVRLGLNFQTGVNVDLVAVQARAALVNYINALPPGASFVIADALQTLRTVAGLVVLGNEIISPPGNVIPLRLEALRASMGTVSASSLQPDRALQSGTNPDIA